MDRKYHKYLDTQVVFQEFPDEITLAINITNCPCHCPGCHSKELAEDIGDILDEPSIDKMIAKNSEITCIGFMGGDSNPAEVVKLAKYVRKNYPDIKVGWYSGRNTFPLEHGVFHYIKLGPWIEEKGPLTSKTTNQVMYMNISEKDDNYMNPTFIDIAEQAFRAPKPYDPDYFDYQERKRRNITRQDIKAMLDNKNEDN